jgi:hypothetical protein
MQLTLPSSPQYGANMSEDQQASLSDDQKAQVEKLKAETSKLTSNE